MSATEPEPEPETCQHLTRVEIVGDAHLTRLVTYMNCADCGARIAVDASGVWVRQ